MQTTIYNLTLLLLFVLAIFGWCYNIYKLFHLDGMSGELAVRAIGIIVAPLGAIMGYI